MHGNIWEWCQDGYEPSYYAALADRPALNPVRQPGARHVCRGGCWHDIGLNCHASYRCCNFPDTRHPVLGFRVALTINAATRQSWR